MYIWMEETFMCLRVSPGGEFSTSLICSFGLPDAQSRMCGPVNMHILACVHPSGSSGGKRQDRTYWIFMRWEKFKSIVVQEGDMSEKEINPKAIRQIC